METLLKKQAILNFKITEFKSFASKKIIFTEKQTPEETFKSILTSLGKKFTNNWESIEFDFNGSIFLVCKHWLIETNGDWELSHQIQ